MTATYFTLDDLSFKRFFTWSIILHVVVTAAVILAVWIQRSGNAWGGIGGGNDSSAVSVNLVPNAGIPMPRPNIPTESEAVDPTTGLHKSEPPPPEFKTDATKIPEFKKEKPLPPSNKSKVFEKRTPPAENAVPFGKGGQMDIPSGYSNTPGPLSGGISATGQGGGDFAGRYPWYVESVRRAINQNWYQNTIDTSTRAARRARTTVTFTISRNGTVSNIRISESSGNRSMDDSAQRALLSIDHFPQLPADYAGRSVDVIFDFDLAMTR